MSDNKTEQDQKTEEATEHRLEQARKEGQFPVSKDLSNWFLIFASALIFMTMIPSMSTHMAEHLRFFIEQCHGVSIPTSGKHIFLSLISNVGIWVVAFLSIILVAAILSHGMQTRFKITFKLVRPKFERISPFKGIKRLVSLKSLVEVFKSLIKLSVIGYLLYVLFKSELVKSHALSLMALKYSLIETKDMVQWLLISVLSLYAFIAGGDYVYQRFMFRRNLRMTRQELKDEYKNLEGDPYIKGKIRQIRQEKARMRMASAVKKATVIITNPTHFAVALQYDMDTMVAPVVVAKGVDYLALRIRELGKKYNISIVENPPLARSLYKQVNVDQEIPPELYKAVAEIIRYVLNIKPKRS